jgi:hypothetical protein
LVEVAVLRRIRIYIAIAAATLGMVASNASAQSSPSPEEIAQAQQQVEHLQQARLASLKQALQSPDAEFKILQPKLLRVLILQYQQTIGFSGISRRPRALNGPIATVLSPSEVQKARMELQDALDKQDVTTGEVVEKLKAFHSARARARAELQAAQADLRDFLTLRQEAVLVGMGWLE